MNIFKQGLSVSQQDRKLSLTPDLTWGANAAAHACLDSANKLDNNIKNCKPTLLLTSAESPKAGPHLKCVVILLFLSIYSGAEEEKQVTALGPGQGRHAEKSGTNPRVSLKKKKVLMIIVGFAVVLGPAGEAFG